MLRSLVKPKMPATQLVDLFLGERGDEWDASVAGMTYRTFEPTDKAWSILRQMLLMDTYATDSVRGVRW